MKGWPKKIKAYLHSNKEDMYELAKDIDLDEEARCKFMYALYEVEFTLLVDEDGGYKIIEVDKVSLG